MSLELHVWGPAFGLPSIDAPCLAAIAYLRECLPRGSWKLVASTDEAESPFEDLPVLRDGKRWVSGFRDIVNYIRELDESWDLDKDLSPNEAADCTAYTSFLESRGQPLVDLSLFVSSENYSTCTSPALGRLLPWPNSWFVPHRVREKARKTSEHLGLSGLDVDSAQDDSPEKGLSAHIPKSLRKPRQTVSAMLGHDTKRSKFRLDAVTSDFLAPLDELLSDGEWLIADHATSVDCLALGFLALMQLPGDVPQPWLRESLNRKYPKLDRWARKRQGEWFAKCHSRETVDSSSNDKSKTAGHAQNGTIEKASKSPTVLNEHELPWMAQPRTLVTSRVNSLILNAVRAVPVLSACLKALNTDLEHEQTQQSRRNEKQKLIERGRARELWFSQILTSSFLALIVSGVLAYNGIFRLPRWQAGPKPRRFGEAGAMLGL